MNIFITVLLACSISGHIIGSKKDDTLAKHLASIIVVGLYVLGIILIWTR
jgi:hypothetical protein